MTNDQVMRLVIATELGYERWADRKHEAKLAAYRRLPWWKKMFAEKPSPVRPLSMRDEWEEIAQSHEFLISQRTAGEI